jgi:aldose 1-epimerase
LNETPTYTLHGAGGMGVEVSPFGAAIKALWVPDRGGHLINVVLGYDQVGDYVHDTNFIAGVIGRYANRIADARCVIGGREVPLERNDGANQLHGGNPGFHKVLWETQFVDASSIQLTYLSPAGEGGFPGNLKVSVDYRLEEQTLRVSYRATTDAETVVNLTNHPYFNLSGGGAILHHELAILASSFTPVESLIPTGEFREVQGTPFDFRTLTRIGERLFSEDKQLKRSKGFDHNFVLDNGTGDLALAATLRDPSSGLQMELWTTEPGLQLYTGNHLPGKPFPVHGGVCLEPQHFPDSPNRAEFPSTVLRPGEEYRSESHYRFSHFDA